MLTFHMNIWLQIFQFSTLTTQMKIWKFTKNSWLEIHSLENTESLSPVDTQVPKQLPCYQQGLTSSVWLGLRENSGPCSVLCDPGARICAMELSHVLIFPVASCKEIKRGPEKFLLCCLASRSSYTYSFYKSPACKNVQTSQIYFEKSLFIRGKKSPSSGLSLLKDLNFPVF